MEKNLTRGLSASQTLTTMLVGQVGLVPSTTANPENACAVMEQLIIIYLL